MDLVESAEFLPEKGMANFKTVYPRDLSQAVLFLFKAKCEPGLASIRVPAESVIAL